MRPVKLDAPARKRISLRKNAAWWFGLKVSWRRLGAISGTRASFWGPTRFDCRFRRFHCRSSGTFRWRTKADSGFSTVFGLSSANRILKNWCRVWHFLLDCADFTGPELCKARLNPLPNRKRKRSCSWKRPVLEKPRACWCLRRLSGAVRTCKSRTPWRQWGILCRFF